MKKFLGAVSAALILFVSVPFLTAAFRPVFVFAVSAKPVVTHAPIPTPTPAAIDYTLPYPGILPDNPLYFLKDLRDKIIEFLISDPVNKAEFYILQADKKLNMGITLSGMGKTTEANTILAQSLSVRTQAVTQVESILQSGGKVPAFVLEKLTLSIRKHEEVLSGMHRPTDVVSALLSKAQGFVKGIK